MLVSSSRLGAEMPLNSGRGSRLERRGALVNVGGSLGLSSVLSYFFRVAMVSSLGAEQPLLSGTRVSAGARVSTRSVEGLLYYCAEWSRLSFEVLRVSTWRREALVRCRDRRRLRVLAKCQATPVQHFTSLWSRLWASRSRWRLRVPMLAGFQFEALRSFGVVLRIHEDWVSAGRREVFGKG